KLVSSMLTKTPPCDGFHISMVSNKSVPCKAKNGDMTNLVVLRIFLVVGSGDCLDNKVLKDLFMAKAKTRAKKKTTTSSTSSGEEKEYIVVDEAAGLIFENEEDLFGYFTEAIDKLEQEYQSLRSPDDFTDEE